jgi:hypothetical protein
MVEIAPEMLLEVLTDGNSIHAYITDGIPEAAMLHHCFYNEQNGTFCLVLWHQKFEAMTPGQEFPILKPTISTGHRQMTIPGTIENDQNKLYQLEVENGRLRVQANFLRAEAERLRKERNDALTRLKETPDAK